MMSPEEMERRIVALEKHWRLTDREQSTMRHIANLAMSDINERFDMLTNRVTTLTESTEANFLALRTDNAALRTDNAAIHQRLDALHSDNVAILTILKRLDKA